MSDVSRAARSLKLSLLAGVVAAGIGSASSVSAHHAFAAEFDGNQPIQIKGAVSKARWVNPHSWLFLDVKQPDGSTVNWGFEFGAPFALKEKGLTKSTLPIGTEVTVNGFKSKNGKPFGYAVTVTLPDGRSFQTGGAQDAPANAARQ